MEEAVQTTIHILRNSVGMFVGISIVSGLFIVFSNSLVNNTYEEDPHADH